MCTLNWIAKPRPGKFTDPRNAPSRCDNFLLIHVPCSKEMPHLSHQPVCSGHFAATGLKDAIHRLVLTPGARQTTFGS